jgi:hypothetical protein
MDDPSLDESIVHICKRHRTEQYDTVVPGLPPFTLIEATSPDCNDTREQLRLLVSGQPQIAYDAAKKLCSQIYSNDGEGIEGFYEHDGMPRLVEYLGKSDMEALGPELGQFNDDYIHLGLSLMVHVTNFRNIKRVKSHQKHKHHAPEAIEVLVLLGKRCRGMWTRGEKTPKTSKVAAKIWKALQNCMLLGFSDEEGLRIVASDAFDWFVFLADVHHDADVLYVLSNLLCGMGYLLACYRPSAIREMSSIQDSTAIDCAIGSVGRYKGSWKDHKRLATASLSYFAGLSNIHALAGEQQRIVLEIVLDCMETFPRNHKIQHYGLDFLYCSRQSFTPCSSCKAGSRIFAMIESKDYHSSTKVELMGIMLKIMKAYFCFN